MTTSVTATDLIELNGFELRSSGTTAGAENWKMIGADLPGETPWERSQFLARAYTHTQLQQLPRMFGCEEVICKKNGCQYVTIVLHYRFLKPILFLVFYGTSN